jgi:hypothetical protein
MRASEKKDDQDRDGHSARFEAGSDSASEDGVSIALGGVRSAVHALHGGLMTNAVKPCYQSRLSDRACTKCGTRSKPVHIPTGHIGYYCAACCPACNPTAAGEQK